MPDKTINLVNDIVINAENRGVARLVIENTHASGNKVIINEKEIISFGSYGYLALETDNRLKLAAIDGIEKFGLQYPSSRVYTSLAVYGELESLFEQIFGFPVVLTTSLSLGHAGVMPVLIDNSNILLLDQHVHASVQDAAQRLKAKGVQLKIVRHNDLVALEKLIQEFSKRYTKIWYAIDSIYSMFGDVAPLKELHSLLEKYPTFHLYIDDSHGISSYGKNGAGWVLDQIDFHERMILTTGMAKAFGTKGGVFAIRDPKLYEFVRNCTGSLIFSGGHSVPVLYASIASAKIHLSDEIKARQNSLADKIYYCHKLLKEKGLPDVSDPRTPIFFVGLGLLKVGYNMVKRMINDGFYVNLASFPAVSESCTGIRFTITLNHSLEDIENLVDTIAKNYPLALNEENVKTDDIRKAFRKVASFPDKMIDLATPSHSTELKINTFHSISELDHTEWDKRYNNQPLMKSDFLNSLESTFHSNPNQEDNWKFYYFQVIDSNNDVVLTTFFTRVCTKEDMLAPKNVSERIELKRINNKYFFSSDTLLMGSLVTEGSHLIIDHSNNNWKQGLSLLLNTLEQIKDQENINTVVLRDFELDIELFNFLRDESFLKMELPDSHQILSLEWKNEIDFMAQFNKHRRSYLRKNVFGKSDNFNVKINTEPKTREASVYWKLYQNVNRKSLEINNFDLPKFFFGKLVADSNWEVIELRLNESVELIGMMLCHKSNETYIPLFIGMNYEYLHTNCYPQLLWQTIKRGKELGVKQIPLGFTASQVKRKFGATTEAKYGFVKMKDNFALMQMNLFE